MSFGDHLEDLRRRVILSLIPPLPLAIVLFLVSDWIIGWLIRPLLWALRGHDMPTIIQVLGPAETLGTKLKLSIIAALILSAPWIVWQVWLFIRPGLYRHERRFVYLLLPGSAVLTTCGVLLMQYGMLPLMLWVLVGIGKSMDLGVRPPTLPPSAETVFEQANEVRLLAHDPEEPQPGEIWMTWRKLDQLNIAYADDHGRTAVLVLPRSASVIAQEFQLRVYIGFALLLHLAIVLAFQMPLVILLLGWVGLVQASWLKLNRKYALMICAVVSAVITPADVISQIMMLIPLYLLYELGILLLVFAPASRVAEGSVFSLRQPGQAMPRRDDYDQADDEETEWRE